MAGWTKWRETLSKWNNCPLEKTDWLTSKPGLSLVSNVTASHRINTSEAAKKSIVAGKFPTATAIQQFTVRNAKQKG